MIRTKRSYSGIFIDTITFPFRAFFMGTEGKFGLSSLREERMRFTAPLCKGKVLDVGCGPGNLFINEFIGKENGTGIDVFPYEGVETVIENMTKIPFGDCCFDTITLLAVSGYIPKSQRIAEFKEFARLLKPNGLLIVTQGYYGLQLLIHKWEHLYRRIGGSLDKWWIEEDGKYGMSKKELLYYLNIPPLKFVKRKHLMTEWGLNSTYIAQKQ